MLEWKSFHLSEYCCSPLDEDEEAAMASVPSGPTAEGTRGAIVLTLAPHEDTFTSPSRRVSPRTPLFFYRHPSNATATRTVGCLSLRDYVLRSTMLSLSLLSLLSKVKRDHCFLCYACFRSVNFDPLPSNVLESNSLVAVSFLFPVLSSCTWRFSLLISFSFFSFYLIRSRFLLFYSLSLFAWGRSYRTVFLTVRYKEIRRIS